MGCFESVARAALPPGRLDGLKEAVERRTLTKLWQCLVVVLDLRRTEPALLSQTFEALAEARGSSQLFVFALEPPGGLSFRHFTEAIASHVIAAGGVADADAHLRAWCRPEDGGAPLARQPFKKNSPWWLRNVGHDFLVLTLQPMCAGDLRAAGLWEFQREIDYWQDAIRNTLVFPYHHSAGRLRPAESLEQETESFRRAHGGEYRLAVPRSLLGPLGALGLVLGRDLSAYDDSGVDAAVAAASREGAVVLLHEPHLRPASPAGKPVPRVLVVPPGYALPWARWTEHLSQNVLGAYTREELLARIGTEALVRVKRGYWRAFALRPLPAAMCLMREHVEETGRRLKDHANVLLRSLVGCSGECAWQLRGAEGTYFGWAGVRPRQTHEGVSG
jgi:hypothetical protein